MSDEGLEPVAAPQPVEGALPTRPAGSKRVRVTAPQAGGPPPAPTVGGGTSDVQGLYVRSLIRSQLRLAVVVAVGFMVATALFVVAIALVPDLDRAFVFGVPVSWLLLGFGLYPLVITVGVLYVRAAARNEARYRALAEDS
ncbi:DUF485 domain-containing protein [Agromyces endophyticus]|uniref:DUF485 domain-containing protein n=1 Tax=Agromyces sp. H17E-10 TaxID=2932244 RepID=UPI001FD56E6E|nr:DUF485 domain-containing protein [Agromyces sp. H17E-10]UOQ87786.1 DUF485 domain-containing protein [Agromyces sp. H17E-10]